MTLTSYSLLSQAPNSFSNSSKILFTCSFFIISYSSSDIWNILYIFYLVVILVCKLTFLLYERLKMV